MLCGIFTEDLQSGKKLRQRTMTDQPIVVSRYAETVIGVSVKAIRVPGKLKEKHRENAYFVDGHPCDKNPL